MERRNAMVGVVIWLAAATSAFAQTVRPVGVGQDVAVTRTGTIPGLGEVSGSIGWDNRVRLSLAVGGFIVSRTITPSTGEIEIAVSGGGEAPTTIRLGGSEGLTVTRGARVVRGTSDADAVAALMRGRAIAAVRAHLGDFERQLLTGTRPARADDPHAYGFLLTGALLSALGGDVSALGRARDLIGRRIRAGLRAARFDFRACVTEYERYLLKIDTDRTNCLQAANSRDAWYERAADRLGCEIEFMAAAIAGEGQFASCSALGAIVV